MFWIVSSHCFYITYFNKIIYASGINESVTREGDILCMLSSLTVPGANSAAKRF